MSIATHELDPDPMGKVIDNIADIVFDIGGVKAMDDVLKAIDEVIEGLKNEIRGTEGQ